MCAAVSRGKCPSTKRLCRTHGHASTRPAPTAGLAALAPPAVGLGMVAARLLEPASKLATTRWWQVTTLPAELGVEEADEEDLYAALDWLVET